MEIKLVRYCVEAVLPSNPSQGEDYSARPARIVYRLIKSTIPSGNPPRQSMNKPSSQQGSQPTDASSQQPPSPTINYWHVWTDEDGISHQSQRQIHDFQLKSIAPPASPQWLGQVKQDGATVSFTVLPVGWTGTWHENPKPQWIIPLSGCWFVETMDGQRVEMGVGEISFGADQNTKEDAQGRKGHLSGTVGNEPAVLMLVQFEKMPSIE